MKRLLAGVVILFWCAFLVGECFAKVDAMHLPRLSGYVTDLSNVLSASGKTSLEQLGIAHNKNTSEQANVLLFPNRDGNELADIGLKVFRENALGDAKRNDGVLLIIATEEKKLRIVTGYGVESRIPDLLASRIVESIRPKVNSGDYAGAIRDFYGQIATPPSESGSGKSVANKSTKDPSSVIAFCFFMGIMACLFGLAVIDSETRHVRFKIFFGWALWILIGFLILGILVLFIALPLGILGIIISFIRSRGWITSSDVVDFLVMIINSNSRWGGGSSGGGGGFSGGGGGSSGGGGAGD